jgi:hypothetical protein
VLANLAAIEEALATAAADGVKLVLLQELHNGPYFCQQQSADEFDRAESIPGPTTERLGAAARRHGLVIVASIFERRAAGLYHNTAVVIEADGSIAGIYRKMHIPDDPAFWRSSTSPPAIWASIRSTPRSAGSACWCAGTSGIRKPPADGAGRGRVAALSDRDRLGSRAIRSKNANGSGRPGSWPSAATRSATGCRCSAATAAASSQTRRDTAPALISGATASSVDRKANSLPRPAASRPCCVPPSI